MSRKRRKGPLYVAAFLTVVILALILTCRSWGPLFFKRTPAKARIVEPMLPASGVREGAQEAVSAEKTTVLKKFSFDKGQDSLKEWEEKVFKGKTVFEVEKGDGFSYLSSKSQDACSGLFVKTQEPATPGLWVSWKWRAHEFPQKKHPELLSNRSEDDFSARFYVIFLASNFFRSDVIEYIWDEKFPPGKTEDSPYSDRVKLLVIRSGPASGENEGWANEERDLYGDYQKLFGKAPRNPVGLLAVMSDSDNTGSKASADFAEIVLKRKESKKSV